MAQPEKDAPAVDGSGNADESSANQATETYLFQLKLNGDSEFNFGLSPAEHFIDIRQMLLESPETFYLTNYDFKLNGAKVNEHIPLANIESLKPGNTEPYVITLQPTCYDERSSRAHVQRLRAYSFATNTIPWSDLQSPAVFSAITGINEEELQKEVEAVIEKYSAQEAAEEQAAKAAAAAAAAVTAPEANGAAGTAAGTAAEAPKADAPKDKPAAPAKDHAHPHAHEGEPEEPLEPRNGVYADVAPFQPATLATFFPTPTCVSKVKTSEMLNHVAFSGFNPPPPNRALMGDLFYLDVVTVENRKYCITACTSGFFVNKTTRQVFDPAPALPLQSCHTLAGLMAMLSPQFSQRFSEAARQSRVESPLEASPAAYRVYPWVLPVLSSAAHRFDYGRAEDAWIQPGGGVETDALIGVPRDWCEEYQSLRELPHETLSDRIIRDRALARLHVEFIEAAVRGARLIVGKALPSMNPNEPEAGYMYLYNSIFFTKVNDARQVMKDLGGDESARLAANNDLRAVDALADLDVENVKICSVMTALIKLRGVRLLAQCVVPGSLRQDKDNELVRYGTIDNGASYSWDKDFHKLLTDASSFFHAKPHMVREKPVRKEGEDGGVLSGGAVKEVELALGIETKGVMGSDRRWYAMDLFRTTPRDANYPNLATDAFKVLRPELVAQFHRSRQPRAPSVDDADTVPEPARTAAPAATATATEGEAKKDDEKKPEAASNVAEKQNSTKIDLRGFAPNTLRFT